jgi:NTE family protein
MATRALVLGGGGPVGIAWESGLVAGLERGGVRLGDADRIVGTSAGSVVGAQLALGRGGEQLLAAQIAQSTRPASAASADAAAGTAPAAPDLGPLMQLMLRRPTAGPVSRELLIEIGTFALGAHTGSEAAFIASFGRAIAGAGVDAFPERFACTAVDVADGSFHTWDRAAGVELSRAIASSCAVPGIFPPITIGERRYMDGGIRSATNADLATGFERVLIVAVAAGAMAGPALERVEAEAATLRAGGAEVRVIAPDDSAAATFGVNLMDGSRRGEVADAGARQGEAEAERLRAFWV